MIFSLGENDHHWWNEVRARGRAVLKVRPPPSRNERTRRRLGASPEDTLKGVRDRAILAALLYHGMQQEELCSLKVKDLQSRQGVIHLKVKGKRGKIRFVPTHPQAQRLIENYLLMAGHADDNDGALFRPVRNNRTGELERPREFPLIGISSENTGRQPA